MAGGPSLSSLLTRRLALIALAVALVNLAAVALRYASLPDELSRSALQRMQDRIAGDLRSAPLGQATPALSARFGRYPDDYAVIVLDANGNAVEAVNALLLPAEPPWPSAARHVDATLEVEDRVLRVSARDVEHPAGRLRVVVAMAEDPAGWKLGALLDELATHVGLPLVPVILLLIGANAALVQRAMRPVLAAADWARSLRPGVSNPPLPAQEQMPEEISTLAEALERMTERLDAALSAERRRSAEAAHALRTPLAALTARLDALPPGLESEVLRSDVRQLARTVQQLLSAASAEVAAPGQAEIDLAEVAGEVLARLAPFAHAQGAELALETASEPAVARVNPAAVELALVNLVENAVLHGGDQVTLVTGPGPQLRVIDNGPGLPPGEEEALFEPFKRGANARTGGTGLGLAIVRRAMTSQGGSVTAGTRPGGGAEVLIRFPGEPGRSIGN